MRAINVTTDRDAFLQKREDLVMPAVHTWTDSLDKNALVLERSEREPGTVEQRDLRREETDALLENHRLHGLTRGHVVIKTLFAGICGSDVKNAFADECAYNYRPGKTLLHEVSGVVVAIGEGVHGLEIGDLVVANPLLLNDASVDIFTGEQRTNRTKPFCSIQTHGFGREMFLHPASHVHKVDSTKIGPIVATLAEPFACAHAAVERQGGLTRLLHGKRMEYPELDYGRYNLTVVIIGGGGLGINTAVMAKHLGAETVIVLDNNKEKAAFVSSLGEGFHGLCTDWMKSSGTALDTARLAEMHKRIRELSQTPLLNTKGADMLINCVNNPASVLLHRPVLSGSLNPVVVQAGGSFGHISWNEHVNREMMTSEITYTHSYRYTQSDFKAALHCISSNPEQAGRLIRSITAASDDRRSGARRALHNAFHDRAESGKRLVSYIPKHFAADVFQDRITSRSIGSM